MVSMKRMSLAPFAIALALAGGAALSQPPADNTRTNQSYSSGEAATADSQKQDAADVRLTQQIRKSVMAES